MARRKDDKDDRQKAVPTSRLGRFGRVARMAGGVAGGMLAEGTRQLRAGNRPKARDMLMTPSNARRVGDQLATMRGAAMKVGQMLSMDAGEFLPRELADILARLRSEAQYMPAQQLQQVMCEAYGEDWQEIFYGFEMQPLAAASIGQVHRATSPEGQSIVLKVQYPGVVKSIDSDVDNIASLLKISGLLPSEFTIQPLLDDAKAQLKDEADYCKEAQFLQDFEEFLADDDRFVVPTAIPELVRPTVLPMTYVSGEPIDSVVDMPQVERDRVMSALLELMLKEIFDLRLMQTDPNFANYQYRRKSGEIVLLDFGATRAFKAGFVNGYKRLVRAAIAGDRDRVAAAADKLGYAVGQAGTEYRSLLQELFLLALDPLREDAVYDFATTDMAREMSALGEEISAHREFWQAPPSDAVYFHRKLGGMFMLASRLKARVNVHQLMLAYL